MSYTVDRELRVNNNRSMAGRPVQEDIAKEQGKEEQSQRINDNAIVTLSDL
jgi:hypothetical protein